MNIESSEELPNRVTATLYKANLISSKSILETPECDLLKVGSLSHVDVEHIYSATGKQAKLSPFIKGDELEASNDRRWSCVTTGCPEVDKLLDGGVLTRGITELAGQSGCGKTQLCLQLALTVQLPVSAGGLSAGAAYVSTEDVFPIKRLNQLIKSCPAVKEHPEIKFANYVFVEHPLDSAGLMQCVLERLPQLLQRHNIGLVVIDSVAAVFRADYSITEMVQRARDLRLLASRLHELSYTHKCAVVCVNQVTDVKKGDNAMCVPSLGLAWANLVTCRLQMFRNNNGRQLHTIFSPHLPRQWCQYDISEAGVVGVE